MENLLAAWQEFLCGKRNKPDVQRFRENLLVNIRDLHGDLIRHCYQHGAYYHFTVNDPKRRDIHKASVRDRLLHHAIYRRLYPFFDRCFVSDSFSCRTGKGVHKAMDRFRLFYRKVSKNTTLTCWVLKLDIRKFFASIDHNILLSILYRRIPDLEMMWLCECVISSFSSEHVGIGLPLGNLTSQLFANVYLNELDQFIKHTVKAKYYIRYADDFVIISESRSWLIAQLSVIEYFLQSRLRLRIHPKKIELKTIASGVDFLGWVHFSYHRVIRTKTGKRARRNVKLVPEEPTFNSYIGLLKHGNAYRMSKEITDDYWMLSEK